MSLITVCSLNLFTHQIPIHVIDADTNETKGIRYCAMDDDMGRNVATIAGAFGSNTIVLLGNPEFAQKLREDIYSYAAQEYSDKEITVIIQ